MQSGSDRIWHLLSRHLTSETTLDEQREIEVFLRDRPELASQFEIHTAYFSQPQTKNDITPQDKEDWQNMLTKLKEVFPNDFAEMDDAKKTEKKSKTISINKTKNRRIYIAAASLLLAALSIFFIVNCSKTDTLYAHTDNLIEFKTSPSQKTQLTLPDGSVVWLNSNSKLTYNKDFGKHNRDITLEGEAFFDVIHKAELPMTVHAGLINVKVKGTAFNVNSFPNKSIIETSLIRGSIELTVAGQSNEEKIVMKPDEKVIIDMDNTFTTTNNKKQRKIIGFKKDSLSVEAQSGLIPEVAWIENKLVFNSESFVDVTKKMEQWYNVEFVIKNNSIMYEKFTGVFHTETLQEALEALKMTYKFNYSINKNQVIIK